MTVTPSQRHLIKVEPSLACRVSASHSGSHSSVSMSGEA